MLKRLSRRFYSAKYVFSVHLHSVSPWFAHDKPVKVVWKRGAKKHKRGETSTKMPARLENDHVNAGALKIEEGFELGVTLYAESNKTKRTGPYGQKDLKMVIMEVDDDGSIFSILGALTINLNEYVGGLENKIRLPVQCDKEIVTAVGQPYIDISIRSWYKQGGTASASSGMSSTGYSEHHGSDTEDPEFVFSPGDNHLDPVKPLDVLDPRKSIGHMPIDAVPEHAVRADGTIGQATIQTREVTLNETEDIISTPPATIESTTAISAIEAEKNMMRDEELMEEETTDTPSALMEHLQESVYVLPTAADLTSVPRNSRLSTINSEAGEEVVEFMDSNEDALKEFIRKELGSDDMGNIPEVIMAAQSMDQEREMNPIHEQVQSDTQDTEAETVKETTVVSSEIHEPGTTLDNEVKECSAPAPTPPPTPVAEPVSVSKPSMSTVPTTSTKPTESKVTTQSKSISEAKPMSVPVRQKKTQTKPRQQPRRGLFWWLPGSNLVCCQPVLPREP